METLAKTVWIAVQADDAAAFQRCVREKRSTLSLCYGRFPLLSLCYLYNSRKIIKNHRYELSNVQSYTYVEEYPQIYLYFKKRAGRSLRLYTNGKGAITPPEMLAVLGDDARLNEIYSRYQKDERAVKNIQNVYRLTHKRAVEAGADGLAFAKKRLERWQIIVLVSILVLAVLMTALPVPLWNLARASFGGGTAESPYRVENEGQLINALTKGSDAYTLLTADITLSEAAWARMDAFGGTLDGGGHTLVFQNEVRDGLFGNFAGTLKDISVAFAGGVPNGVIEVLSGTVQNVTFHFPAGAPSGVIQTLSGTLRDAVFDFGGAAEEPPCAAIGTLTGTMQDSTLTYTDKEGTLTADTALVAQTNTGILRNITLTATGLYHVETDAATLGFAGFVYENKGEIAAASGYLNIEIFGNRATDVLLAGIAYINTGSILNSEIKEDSVLWGDTVDVAGFVGENTSAGLVSGCINRAFVTQTTGLEKWYPHAAGIALNNYGEIRSSVNYGDITVTDSAEAEANYLMNLAGIASVNYAAVKQCANYGSVLGMSNAKVVFAGGIVARNIKPTSSPEETTYILGCVSFGAVTASTTNEALVRLAGGIAADSDYGAIRNCISTAHLAPTDDTGSLLSGGILAASTVLLNKITSPLSNNYYLQIDYGDETKMLYGFAGVRGYGFGHNAANYAGAIIAAATPEEIKKLETYWEYETVS